MIDNRRFVVGKYIPFDFEQITVSTSAIGLTASKLASTPKPKIVIVTLEISPLRFRFDGTDPSATVGHLLDLIDTLILEGYTEMNNVKFIRKDSVDSTLFVTYLR